MLNRRYILVAALVFQGATVPPPSAAVPFTFLVQESAIESSPATDVNVRVVVTNSSKTYRRVDLMTARNEVKLLVVDHEGKVVQPSRMTPEMCSSGCAGAAYRLTPGASFSPGVSINKHWSEWVPLSEWGYPYLSPGTYTISAHPGFKLGARYDDSIDLSNQHSTESNILKLTVR